MTSTHSAITKLLIDLENDIKPLAASRALALSQPHIETVEGNDTQLHTLPSTIPVAREKA